MCRDSELPLWLKGGFQGVAIVFNLLWHWQDVTPLLPYGSRRCYNTELQVLDWRGLLSIRILKPQCHTTKQAGISLADVTSDWKGNLKNVYLIASSASLIRARYLAALTGPCGSIRKIWKTRIGQDCFVLSSRSNLMPITLELDSESN